MWEAAVDKNRKILERIIDIVKLIGQCVKKYWKISLFHFINFEKIVLLNGFFIGKRSLS